jgi:chloramphenicol O-acetyltransferase type A
VGVTSDVDVTELVGFCKERGVSFYLVFLHVAALAADGVRELRQRIRGEKVMEYEACPTSHTELCEDGTYCYCTLHHQMDLHSYLAYAETERAQCRLSGSIEEDSDVECMYFVSALPWLHYTALIQPVAGGDESNPRITWGKFQQDASGRLQLPVSLLAHHGLVDGIHIAQFYRNLEIEIQKCVEQNL